MHHLRRRSPEKWFSSDLLTLEQMPKSHSSSNNCSVGSPLRTNQRTGILLSLDGQRTGEQFKLPPDTRSFQEVGPGEYRLRSTGEVVVNPDFTVTFSIREQAKALAWIFRE
ncbi:hypothetical protein VAPA_2c11880 [Variovorax paradoxus B4]|uniref:Uncharacterized protein n=1 Tax=Variovorax paradoxus B4 TaxID=1246301 RepID=T1XLI8_VARPD|nr:hypothetical protein VAPA_2c11880 [Variovorax paradoxus B4]